MTGKGRRGVAFRRDYGIQSLHITSQFHVTQGAYGMDSTKCTLYSSGLKGAEETFGEAAEKRNINEVI